MVKESPLIILTPVRRNKSNYERNNTVLNSKESADINVDAKKLTKDVFSSAKRITMNSQSNH